MCVHTQARNEEASEIQHDKDDTNTMKERKRRTQEEHIIGLGLLALWCFALLVLCFVDCIACFAIGWSALYSNMRYTIKSLLKNNTGCQQDCFGLFGYCYCCC